MEFVWDGKKAAANLRKHGIAFELAEDVFLDEDVVLFEDRVVDGERRWHAIGMASGALVLVVVHTLEDEENEVYRVISLRKADKRERRIYAHGG